MGPDGPDIITDPGFAEVTYVGGPRTILGFDLAIPTDRDRVHRIAVAKRTWLRPLVYQQFPCANCHATFARLPRGRTLRSVWEDPAVRIGYVTSIHARGLTSNATGIIALTLAGLALSPRNIAATLLHELAHVNGAEVDRRADAAALWLQRPVDAGDLSTRRSPRRCVAGSGRKPRKRQPGRQRAQAAKQALRGMPIRYDIRAREPAHPTN